MTDGKLLSGQALKPEQTLVSAGGRARLHYQGDGNLVTYLDGQPFWASHTAGHSAGQLTMQPDGNLVVTNARGLPVGATNTAGHPGSMVQLQDDGNFVIYEDPAGPLAGMPVWGSASDAFSVKPAPAPEPIPVAPVRQLQGYARTFGASFGDDSGPRILHGCSWFPALCIEQQDPDECSRQLDRIMPYQQYVRVLWRLNGWHWGGDATHASANLSVDPVRDPWFEAVLYRFLMKCKQRGIRVNLSSGDMERWTEAQMEHWFRRVAEVSRDVDQQTVWLQAITNEMRGTWRYPPFDNNNGETPEHVEFGRHLMRIVKAAYPWNHHALSDSQDQDKAGMQRLSPAPATCALMHDVRHDETSALRHAFNTRYENYPGLPIVQDEPTGPNGSFAGAFSRLVYQPIEDRQTLFALYTIHVMTGQASTYFNDPSLCSRQPLDSTWGFKELPSLWRQMGIPEDVGQGTPKPGHHKDAPLQVGGGVDRADSMICLGGNVAFGVVHGGTDWDVRSGWDADVTMFKHDGTEATFKVKAGERIAQTSKPVPPAVVRMVRT